MHLDETQLQSLRTLLSDKGRQINEGLIATQAGKQMPPGVAVPVTIDPSKPLDIRLKDFLQLIHARMRLIREGNESYGICAKCKEPIQYSDLEYEPWLEKHTGCWNPED